MSKKKIAVLTCSVAGNYGTVLQCYATQCAFSNEDVEIEIVHYSEEPIVEAGKWAIGTYSIKSIIASILFYIPRKKKRIALDKFREKLHYSDKLFDVSNKEELNDYLNQYRCVCIGSDQVWNPNIQDPDVFLLMNVHDGVMKCSYSSSMGASVVNGEYQDIYLSQLERFKYVSVRENGLQNFLKKSLDKEIYRILDPTLYFSRDYWRKLEEEYNVSNKYVFIYLQAHSSKLIKLAKKRAHTLNAEILLLSDRWYPFITTKGRNVSGLSVGQFLYLIDHAEEVLTNSYHGTVFSINFKKKFHVEKTYKNDDRIDTVLEIFKLYKFDVSSADYVENVTGVDMSNVDFILDIEREEMHKYIRLLADGIDNV